MRNAIILLAVILSTMFLLGCADYSDERYDGGGTDDSGTISDEGYLDSDVGILDELDKDMDDLEDLGNIEDIDDLDI